jgi:uridine phosphorylase
VDSENSFLPFSRLQLNYSDVVIIFFITFRFYYLNSYIHDKMKKEASELVTHNNKVYHLDLTQEDVSETIILVGDQGRVQLVSSFFDAVTHKSQKREFACHTGTYKGAKLSVISTGIGTDNVDIVINEIDALFNFNLIDKTENSVKRKVNFIRIGTCGSLSSDIPIGSYILSEGAVGLDNVAHFYDINYSESELDFLQQLNTHLKLPDTIKPYYTESSIALTRSLAQHPNVKTGITVTASGFYGPQGRQLRIPLKTENLNEQLMSFSHNGKRIVNFEMESSALFCLSKALGHQSTTICLAIANRPNGNFLSDYENQMKELILHVLENSIDLSNH